jgi:hypothetical protein
MQFVLLTHQKAVTPLVTQCNNTADMNTYNITKFQVILDACAVLVGYRCLTLFSEHPFGICSSSLLFTPSSFPYACGILWPDPQATVIKDPNAKHIHSVWHFFMQNTWLEMVASYKLQWNQTPAVMGKLSGFVLWALRKGSALCNVGNTWPICKRSQIELDVHFTFENVVIIISSSSVTFNNVYNIV